MAVALRSCLGVDIGSSYLRVAHMEMGKAGPRVVGLYEQPLQLESGLTETQRQQRIGRQLQDLLKSHSVRVKNAVFCLSGQNVFVRTNIKIPKASLENMSRLIRFEARQQIPFPLEKTVMEFQIFEEADTSFANVLLVALKRDFIANFMRLVRRTGLRPMGVSVSSLALYNFHELNDSERDLMAALKKTSLASKFKGFQLKSKKKKMGATAENSESSSASLDGPESDVEPLDAMGFEEIKAYVNLGASFMDIAIPKPGTERMIGFTRSVPQVVGNEMDRAIREKLNLEDSAQAIQIKENEAVVLATDFEVEGDADKVNIDASEAVTAVADRLISELRRTLEYYISQPDGVAVDKIIISGGLARLRYLGSYIEEKMGLPVELAEPKHAQIRLPDPPPTSFSPFFVAMGLAFQGMGLAQNRIDLLPEDFKSIRGLSERRNEVFAMVGMLAIIVLLSAKVGDNKTTEYKRQADAYQQVVTEAKKINKFIKEAEKQNKLVVSAYDDLYRATGWRDYWFVFMGAVHKRRPPEVLIDELYLRTDGNVIIKGRTPNRDALNQFVTALGDDKLKGGVVHHLKIHALHRKNTDRRFATVVHEFRLIIKTLVRQGRVRTIGEDPPQSKTETTAYQPPGALYTR